MKKISSILFAFVCLFALCLGLASCGKKDDGGKPKLFVLTYNNADPNMSGLWYPGFTQYAKEFNFDIKWVDAANDDTTATQALDQAIVSGEYDAYLLNPVDNTNGKTYIEKVRPTKKPCIIWNRQISKEAMDSYDKAYYVGIDPSEGGTLQGKMAAEFLLAMGEDGDKLKADRNGDGKIGYVILRGESGHPDSDARTEKAPIALKDNLKGYEVEEISICNGYGTTGATWDGDEASKNLEQVISNSADKIDVILSNNDGMAITCLKGKNYLNINVPMFGVDALGDALQSIKDGKLKGTIKNDGVIQAKVCLLVVKNMLEGKPATEGFDKIEGAMPYEANGKQLRVHQVMVTPANIDDHYTK